MRVVVAMSGGVDSSVAAALLAEAGHDVIGLSMQLYDQSDGESGYGSCCSLDDLHDAGRVARRLNIPHYIVNFEHEFQRTVVANFVDEYVAGRTPIPCSHCNSDLKFSTLLDRSRAFGAEMVATGHYARIGIDPETGRQVLRRGRDASKDQSYFLFSLTQEQLARASFPVGDLSKDAVRETGSRARTCRCRQAGQPGNLLRARRRLRGVYRATRRRRRFSRRHRQSIWRRAWAITAASIALRWVSERGSASLPLSHCTCCNSARRQDRRRRPAHRVGANESDGIPSQLDCWRSADRAFAHHGPDSTSPSARAGDRSTHSTKVALQSSSTLLCWPSRPGRRWCFMTGTWLIGGGWIE